ncbi:MAG: biotin--[acetyl-CoA-carboxylase] ligase [Chloroflexota bacterium]
MTVTVDAPFLARREHFPVVASTNDVVRGWLAGGEPEVCLAVADEQTAGRGRDGRTWTASPGRALLLSLGFRPAWLAPEHTWRLAAVAGLAMAEAGEVTAGLAHGTIRLKWPNDLVIEDAAKGTTLKLAGLLGETHGLGSRDPTAVVGIGINADWSRAEFPADLSDAMTSLREAGGRPIDNDALLDAFLASLERRVEELRNGAFPAASWLDRQLTTGRAIRLVEREREPATVLAIRSDPDSGALVVADATSPTGERRVHSGEVVHVRLASQV